MDSQRWRECLIEQLRQQRLPPSYIGRLVEELTDHAVDLREENASMDAQEALGCLGTTSDLAVTAGREFRRRTFGGRHPYLTFVFGPIGLVPLLFICMLFGPNCILVTLDAVVALVTGNALFPASEESSTLFPHWAAYCYHHFFRFVPFALAAAIFCRFGRSVGMQRWATVACGIVAVMAGATVSHVRSVDGNFAEWMLMIGLASKPTVSQLLQILAPLAVAAVLLLWTPRRLSTIDSAPSTGTAFNVE
jgi:hypothetical protein